VEVWWTAKMRRLRIGEEKKKKEEKEEKEEKEITGRKYNGLTYSIGRT